MMPTSPTPIDLPHKAYLLPSDIPMWPPAWWTWLVIVAIILLFILGVLWLLRRKRKRAYRKEALKALEHGQQTLDDKVLITHCHELIRRCLVSENKLTLAALPSHALVQKLDADLPEKQHFEQLGEVFTSGPYRKDITLTSTDKIQMIKLTRYWIRKHRV